MSCHISRLATRNPPVACWCLSMRWANSLRVRRATSLTVYFFQQLAEIASRSGGRLIVVGILHQAFDEYSHRLSREMREEWAKIQGRFIDLPVNAGVDEQIALLGKAIESDHESGAPSPLSKNIATMTNRAASGDVPPAVGELLALASDRRLFAGTYLSPEVWPEPT